MPRAFRCDGCKKYFEDEPTFTLQKLYQTVDEPADGWTFHTVDCIVRWVEEYNARH